MRISVSPLVLAFNLAAFVPGGVGKPAHPGESDSDREVFDPAPVLHLRLELPREAVQQLRASPRTFVRGTVHEGDGVYTEVGVHLKGSVGSFRQIGDKPGLSLKFDKFVKRQRFHGLRKLVLNNSVQDPTYLVECIGNELFRAAGVPAQRTGFATVELNGKKLGLYVVTEAVTRDFLGPWFKDPTGNLYEGPGEVTSERLDVDSRGGTSDRADLKELAEAAREPNSTKRMERLEKVLDLERFVSFLAMEGITCHWDGYTTGKNNYHLYHDPSTGRMVFIPHGADQLFQNSNGPLSAQANGLIARSVLKTVAGRRRYRERLRTLVETFNVEAIQMRIRELGAKIRPYLQGGPGGQFVHDGAVQALSSRIAERASSLRAQLEGQLVISAGPPLSFDPEGKARLVGWQTRTMAGNATFQRSKAEGEHGGSALKIEIGMGGECRASWRKKVFLPPGRYQLSGRVRIQGVEPARKMLIPDGGESGADVRLSGEQPGTKLLGDRDWTRSEFEFEIEPEEGIQGEQPTTQVELVCELQASQGAAWFDEGSLELRRLPPRSTAEPGQSSR